MALVKVHSKEKCCYLVICTGKCQIGQFCEILATKSLWNSKTKNNKICPHYIIENLKNGFVFIIAGHANFALL